MRRSRGCSPAQAAGGPPGAAPSAAVPLVAFSPRVAVPRKARTRSRRRCGSPTTHRREPGRPPSPKSGPEPRVATGFGFAGAGFCDTRAACVRRDETRSNDARLGSSGASLRSGRAPPAARSASCAGRIVRRTSGGCADGPAILREEKCPPKPARALPGKLWSVLVPRELWWVHQPLLPNHGASSNEPTPTSTSENATAGVPSRRGFQPNRPRGGLGRTAETGAS